MAETTALRRPSLLQALNQTAAALRWSALTEQEVFDTVKKQIASLGLQGNIALLEEDGEHLIFKAVAFPESKMGIIAKLTGAPPEGFRTVYTRVDDFRKAVESKSPVFTADNSSALPQILGPGMGSLLGTVLKLIGGQPGICTPLIAGGRVLGLLIVVGKNLVAGDTAIMETFANLIAIALDHARLYEARLRDEKKIAESEERYRTVVEHATDGITIAQGARLRYVNPSFARMIGYSPEEVLRQPIWDLIPVEDRARLQERNRRRQAGDPAVPVTFDVALRHKNGGRVDLEMDVCPFRYLEEPSLLITARDVTERKKAEREILLAKAVAEKASRAKSDFLSIMSHELRTPLTSIIGFAQLLQEENAKILDARTRDTLKTILHNALHLQQLINGVLELATLESGHVSVSRQAVPVPKLIDELLAALPVLFKGKRLKLVKHVAAGLPPLETDPVMLKQILFNLLGNAVKFTEKGEIRVEAVREDGAAPRLVLRVRDTGIGIPADKLGVIFDPFQQAHEGINRQYGGSGIGLSIVKSLTEALGGTITVESQLEKGSVFTVTLPYSVSAS